jgi:hypothetical protein
MTAKVVANIVSTSSLSIVNKKRDVFQAHTFTFRPVFGSFGEESDHARFGVGFSCLQVVDD